MLGKILLLENISKTAQDIFEDAGYHVKRYPGVLDRETLLSEVADVCFIGVRSKTIIDKEVFEHALKLQGVGCFCVGTDQVDLVYAKKMNIPVLNSPFCNTRSVAELVIHYMIGLARNLGDKNIEMHRAKWNKKASGCFEIRGKTIGIIGYGNVGAQVSILAEAMGMRVLYYDIEDKLSIGNAVRTSSIDELLSESDFVTLHVPKTSETAMMFGKKQFECMKDSSYLINASRGNVVDLYELANYLECGKLAGAAIDVFPNEPVSETDPVFSRLMAWNNVILTPHIGGSTVEAQEGIGKHVATTALRRVLRS